MDGRARRALSLLPNLVLAFLIVGLLNIEARAASLTVVTAFAPETATPAPGVWYEVAVVGGGTASTVNLVGAGGQLESAQPLPVGAALLTTGAANADMSHVAVADAYGNAGSILADASLEIGYSFYKGSAGDLNAFAAPAFRLTFSNPSAAGDGYGSLVYEPYWQTSAIAPVPTDQWLTAAITSSSGSFWWDGGFGEPNSFGGPPLRTLSEWASVFNADFATAELVAVGVGVGSYNQGQTGYFDNVQVSYTGYDAGYDFEPIPEPSTGLLLLFGLMGLRRYRSLRGD